MSGYDVYYVYDTGDGQYKEIQVPIGTFPSPPYINPVYLTTVGGGTQTSDLGGVPLVTPNPVPDGTNPTYDEESGTLLYKKYFNENYSAGFFDDFIGSSLLMLWAQTNQGEISGLELVDGVGGQIRFEAGTTLSSYSQLALTHRSASLASEPIFKTRLRIPDAISLTSARFEAGFVNSDVEQTDLATSTAMFVLDGGPNWFAQTSTAGGATLASTTLTADTDWHIYEVRLRGTSADFIADGITLTSYTTDLPEGELRIFSRVKTNVPSTTATLLCDFVRFNSDRDGATNPGEGTSMSGGCTIL